jgi:hypothetical protein
VTENPPLVESAIDAYEAVRALNHHNREAIPAPVVYDVLANLKCVGHMLPQAFHQLGQGLVQSMSEYDVYDDGSDPAKNVDLACSYLAEASRKAADIGRLLECAQSAVGCQGYRIRVAEGPAQ